MTDQIEPGQDPASSEGGVNDDFDLKPDVHRGVWARLKRYFLTGLVVAVPIGLTIYLAWWVVTFIDGNVLPLLPDRYNPDTLLPYNIPGLGVLILVAGVTLLGALAANLFGNALINFGERIVGRMPVIRTIYTSSKQIMQTVVAQSDNTFQDVCLFEYPRRGIWVIGFVTSKSGGEIKRKVGEDMLSIFLPTTPNPTSGYLLFVPHADAHILDMSVEDGAKLIISAGLVMPDDVPDPAATNVSESKARRFLKRAERAAAGK